MKFYCALGSAGVVILLAVLAGACLESDEPGMSDAIKDIRDDPVFKEQTEELRTIHEDCIATSGKIECLSNFQKIEEHAFDACIELIDWELCTLEAEVIAEQHGWQIPRFERDSPLLSDPDFLDSTSECLEDVEGGFCFALFAARAERGFDICSDVWDGDDCAEVLGEIMAHARYEEQLDASPD